MEAGLFLFRKITGFVIMSVMKRTIGIVLLVAAVVGIVGFVSYRQYVVEQYLIKAKLSQRMSRKELEDTIKAEVISRRMQQLFTQQLDIKTQLQDYMEGHLNNLQVQAAQVQEQYVQEMQIFKQEVGGQIADLERKQQEFISSVDSRMKLLEARIAGAQTENHRIAAALKREIGGVNSNAEKSFAQILGDIRRIEKLVEKQDRSQKESLSAITSKVITLENSQQQPVSGGKKSE
jgi:hypothetical protein